MPQTQFELESRDAENGPGFDDSLSFVSDNF